MSKCKECGREIIWIGTVAMKKIPCDTDQVTYRANKYGKTKIVTPNGEVISADMANNPQSATGIGYISHYMTCPCADRFRKKETKKSR